MMTFDDVSMLNVEIMSNRLNTAFVSCQKKKKKKKKKPARQVPAGRVHQTIDQPGGQKVSNCSEKPR
jgi:hypothetical protein